MSKDLNELRKLLTQLNTLRDQLNKDPLGEAGLGRGVKSAKALTRQIEDSKRSLGDLEDGFGGIAQSIKNIVREWKPGFADPTKEATKSFTKLKGIAEKLSDDVNDISKLSKKQLETTISQIKSEQTKLNLLKKEEGLSEEIRNNLESEYSVTQDLLDQAGKRLKKEKEIAKALGATPAILKGIGSALGKLGLPDLGISEALEETEKILLKQKGRVSSYKAMSVATKQLGKNLAKQVTSANLFQGAMLLSLSVLKELDKTTEDTARNMNMTYNEASAYRQELSAASIINNDQFVTSKGMLETSMAINASLGTNVKLSEDQLATFTKLRTTAGLTNDELVGVNKLTIGTNKSLKDATGEILAQAKLSGLKNKVLLNEKEVLKDIGKTSAATTLSFGKNPGLIAQAVATAKSLGMELGKVDDIANSLLDFESSIQAELEAELLTGKQINLEKARQAALDNDLATVAEEVAKNAGSAAEFGKMNRIQQEAIAKSVGMSREDLAKTLFTQEQLKGLSEDEFAIREKQINDLEAKGLSQAQIKDELANKSIEDLEKQAGIATQFNTVVEKLKESFVLVGTALMPVFNFVAGMVGYLAETPAILAAIVGGLVAMKAVSAFLAVKTMISAVAQIFTSFGQIPFGLGIPLAIGAVGGLMALATGAAARIGDMSSPADGKTQVSTKEGGLFELSPNDDLVAAPGAANKMKNQGGGGNNSALIAKVNQLISVNQQILAKSPVIEMGGNEVGQGINTAEREIQ